MSRDKYEEGYRDGESNVMGDWAFAWCEEFDEPVPSFRAAAERLAAAEWRLKGLEK